MHKLHLFLVTLLISLLLFSCDNEPGLISDNERALMDECMNDAFTSKEEIESNLIGEWALVGFGSGSFASTPNPRGYLTITEDKIVFDYFYKGFVDTTTSHDWTINQFNNFDRVFYSLTTVPFSHELVLTSFCQNYMFSDNTALDGNMHLYQKVQ